MNKNKLMKKVMFGVGLCALCCLMNPVSDAKKQENVSVVREDKAKTQVMTIKDAKDWNSFASQCDVGNRFFEGTTVIIANDISFDGVSNNNYSQVSEFNGTIDGCGHTISGMRSTDYTGLIKKLEGTVKNLTVANSIFNNTGDGNFGAIACYVYDGNIDNCHVKNTTVSNQKEIYKISYVGGIAGELLGESEIKNCTVSSDSKIVSSEYAGGIIGYSIFAISAPVINNCANMAPVSGQYAGGIAGRCHKANNSYNVGAVTGSKESGGVAACALDVVYNCYTSNEACELTIQEADKTTNVVEHFPLADMQTKAFCDRLNNNRGSNNDWFPWEMNSSCVYPVIVKGKDISACTIAVASSGIEYTGDEITPDVAINDGAYVLVRDKDYSVEYTDNIKPGAAKVIIEGKGMYFNRVEKSFEIAKGTPALTFVKPGVKAYGADAVSLSVEIKKGDQESVSYKSSSKKVASVSDEGTVSFVAPGKATISIILDETDNYKALTVKTEVTVKPGKPVVKLSLTGRKIKIGYAKIKGATGYEVQYSLKKNFKSGIKKYITSKSSKTTGQLKRAKRYYVRVRAYKTVKGKKIYSAWSAKKNMVIK